MSWRAEAKCAGADPALFDPVEGGGRYLSAAAEAGFRQTTLTYCQPCPVWWECLQEARAHRDTGLRGGVLLRCKDNRPIRETSFRR